MPHWPVACNVNANKTVKLVLPGAVERKLPSGSCGALAEVLGELLKGVLLKARGDGVFEGLPRAEQCQLGVEEHDGRYGWPAYEARGQDNLA